MPNTNCPCGKPLPFEHCCGRFLAAAKTVPDAEHLMRSRYSAYCRKDTAWLLATWHPATRPSGLDLDEEPAPQWLGLTIQCHTPHDANHATVEFIARYKLNGRAHRLHEISRFERIDGLWFYREGDIQSA